MKVVLSIAGSDSSGGAGIQADLKTFEAFGVFGASAITVLTAQNTSGVQEIAPIDASFVKKQIETVFEDFDVAAIKIGMLFNKEIIETVARLIKPLTIPIVFDPVCISKAGSPLLKEDAIAAMSLLYENVTVITPNHYEAYELFGYTHDDTESHRSIKNMNVPVLVKHYATKQHEKMLSLDQLFFNHKKRDFSSPLIDSSNLHGTGCSYSSAIAANLALGHSLEDSIKISKEFIMHALITAPSIGYGPGPINHKQGGLHVSKA